MFGPYRIESVLGRGGMGEVYRAYDTDRDREVALKLLNAELAEDPDFQERFRRESRAAARLGEPHVIPIHDWGEIDGVLYLDMRLVDGEDLRTVLRRDGRLDPARAVAIVDQVGAALDSAHREGLVHRDVKPENILVTNDDFAYLVDFGIVHGELDARLTQRGTAIGSIAYMAPELFDSEDATPASDVYALTSVLYECLTGEVPHPAKSISAAVKAAVINNPPSPRAVNATVPAAFDSVIARGLAADPSVRYPSARALTDAAHRALHEVADETVTTVISREEPTEVIGSPIPPATTGALYEPTQVSSTSPTIDTSGRTTGPVTPTDFGYDRAAPTYYVQQYGPSSDTVAAPQRRSVVPMVIGGVVALALLGLLGIGGYWLFTQRSGSQTAAPTTPTVTQTVTPNQGAPAVTQVTPAAPATPAPPAGAAVCDSGVAVGTSVTSCAFAQAVRAEYLRTGVNGQARMIVAYSPVTGQSYPMTCTPEGSVVTCRGGNDAVVYVY